jgi:hypothetical protein
MQAIQWEACLASGRLFRCVPLRRCSNLCIDCIMLELVAGAGFEPATVDFASKNSQYYPYR